MFLFVKHKCQRVHLRVSIGFDILLIILNDDKEENLDLNYFLLTLIFSAEQSLEASREGKPYVSMALVLVLWFQ